MIESEKFHFHDPKWAYAESQEIGSTQAPIKVGIDAVSVRCKACGHVWRAGEHGPGRLRPTVQGVIVKCPGCNADEAVSESIFNEKP